MKGQDTTPEKQLNEMETGNYSEKQKKEKKFRIMMLKMTQGLGNRMEKRQEMFTKDLEELKNKQTEMTNILEGINNRTTEAEEQISDLEDRKVEITTAEQNIGKEIFKNEDSLRELWDNIKCTNICIKVPIRKKERQRT